MVINGYSSFNLSYIDNKEINKKRVCRCING